MLFSQPAFLWGLLAVAIPIVVHLFDFRRYRKVYFSNVERLSELQTEQRRRSNLRQWLVLAMRVLAVVFLVLAFAQPVIPSTRGQLRSGSTVVSLYVDNSFSMANAGSDGSLLDAACEKVREVAAAYSVDDRFQLMTNDMAGKEMRWLNRDELLSALEELKPSPAAPMLSAVAGRQVEFLRQQSARNRHAYLIGDFQQTTADLDALPSDSTVRFTLVPLRAVEADNLFVDTVVLDAPAYFVGGSVAVSVTVRNSGGRDAEKVPVKLTVDGHERAVATVDVAAGSIEKTTLNFTLDRTGWVDGCVSLEDYPVTFDDNYLFTLCVNQSVRMLEIDGAQANESLRRLFSGDATVSYQTASRLQHDLTQYDFVALNEPRSLTSGEVQQLSQWVADGGSLLVVPSADGIGSLNDLLQSLQAPRLDRWVQRMVKASGIDYDHALYRGVFSGRSDEMELPAVQGHYTLAQGQSVKQSVITLVDGGDLLAVTPAGAGRVYLFTTPLTARYTDFVNQALFVPTVYNMVLYSKPLPPAFYQLGSNQPVVLQGSYGRNGRQPELVDGQGLSLLPDVRRVAGRWQMVLHGELDHDGIYTLVDKDNDTVNEEHLAFNYPRRESLMAFLDRGEIAKAIDGREEYSLVRSSAKPLTDELKARDGGRQLWQLCIVLALAALAVETLLLKRRR